MPRVLLNATANAAVLRHLFGEEEVRVAELMPLDPPPHTRHLAVRFKRYAKTWLTRNADERRRTLAEVRYLLHKVDPDGSLVAAGQVGLVTFAAIEQEFAEALGIRYVPATAPPAAQQAGRTMHFWAARGSNRLADCAVLLVVGTPALPDAQVYREARALYHDDALPIAEGTVVQGRTRCYVDPRVQALATFRTNEELTQCAHRNRPLRFDGRTVVTLCQGTVENLPITEEYTDLPALTDDGTDRKASTRAKAFAKLDAAAAALRAEGVPVTLRALRERAQVSQRTTLDWRARQATALRADTEAPPG
jgi:hypothetical protein